MNKNYQFFMSTNVESYIGQWVAVNNDKIIASGMDVKKVIAEAKTKFPHKRPFVTKVPEKIAMIF